MIFFFFLIILYFLQGSLYPTGSLISQLSLSVFIIFNGFFFFKIILKKKKPFFLIIWTLFILLFIIGYLLTGEYYDPLYISQLKNILYFMTAIYPVFYWTSKGLLKTDHLRNFAFVLIPVAIVSFYTSTISLILEQNRGNVVNNASYIFVSIIPFVLLIKKRTIALIILFILLAFLVIGSKRGALLLGVFSFIVIVYYNLKYTEGKNTLIKLRNTLLVIIILCVGVFYLSSVVESNSYVLERLQENRSTRPENYLALLNNWYNSPSIFNILFGFGYFSSVNFTPERVMAHNDWLEVFNDFGLFGFTLYLIMVISFTKIIIKHKSMELKYLHFLVILIWLFISLFSMWMNNYANVIYGILIGYLVGQSSLNKN